MQVGKIVVGMLFGLPPAFAGQSFDGEHELLSGTDAQGRSAPLTWVKTTESPWNHAMHSVPGGIALDETLHLADADWFQGKEPGEAMSAACDHRQNTRCSVRTKRQARLPVSRP